MWLTVWLYLAGLHLLEVPNQIAKDRAFVENEMMPLVEFIKSFKLKKSRLPTSEEFNKWTRDAMPEARGITYIRSLANVLGNDKNKFEGVDWTNNFAVGIWRGEWEEYYFSWNDKYDVNTYTWKDGATDTVFCILIGMTPLLIFQLASWRIRAKSSSLKS
jgi:hypothetical protein